MDPAECLLEIFAALHLDDPNYEISSVNSSDPNLSFESKRSLRSPTGSTVRSPPPNLLSSAISFVQFQKGSSHLAELTQR